MFRRLIAAVLLSLAALPAQAVVTNVDVSPDAVSIDGNGSAIVTLRWTITITGSNSRVAITSPSGTIAAVNAPPRPAGGMLRRSVSTGAAPVTVTITERLRIDRTSARYILEDGSGYFSRSFTDGAGTPLAGGVEITAGSRASTTSLTNFQLAFDDRTQFRLAPRGSALTGFVTVTATGRGVLRGTWELAGPTGGFRPIGQERLALSGSRAATFESPQLPTNRPGTYRLRFTVGGPGSGSEFPEITYVVAPDTGAGALGLNGPAPGTSLTGATRFSWSSIPGAVRYRIEFLVPGETQPIAAADTPSTSARLRPFTLARVRGRGEITWRITAYDASGNPIARSQERVIGAGGTFLQGSP